MRFHEQLDDLLGSRARVRLLRVLVHRGHTRLTGRELARLCGASSSQATACLRELEASGLIVREIAGRSHLWRMADSHNLAPALTALFKAEDESFAALKAEIQDVIRALPIRRAILFGSVARGDERSTSDIDLLVVVNSRVDKARTEDALGSASIDFANRFGNPLSSLVLEERQLRSPSNRALLTNIELDGIELETGG